MSQLLLASIGFIPWGVYIILTYYSKNFSQIDHLESASGYSGYLLWLGFIYLVYKTVSLFLNKKNVTFTFWHIAWYFFLHLLLVASIYTSWQNVAGSPFFGASWPSTITLFSHILTLLVYPIFLAFLWRAVGYSVLKYIHWWDLIPLRIRIGGETSIGLWIFATGLLLIGTLGYFTLNALLLICGILILLGVPGWIETYNNIKNNKISFPQHESDSDSVLKLINPQLLTAEFAFIVVSFLISVALINAIRPMPIGWDDLGVYMNFPRIMALTGSSLEGAGMFTWQLITGSGFLWDDIAANAFYVNQLGWILSVIIITSVLSYLLERKDMKYIISLPLLLASIYYMMPMTVFQQAKDMKLDPALMMVSVSAFGIFWHALHQKFDQKWFLPLIGIAGLIIGIAFGIKFTTLILIIAALSLVAYRILWLYWFLGFFFVFLWIFTGGNLWKQMNVWMPTENIDLIHTITLSCICIGIIFLSLSAWKEWSKKFYSWILSNIVLIIGIFIALTPWFIKNGYESAAFTSNQKWGILDVLLIGNSWIGFWKYPQIYSEEEYNEKRKNLQSATITNDGKSQNEDFSRYFGQESGLNNYLKLPANLTFQKNQNGEFTDITYIFFALLPSLLLFVPGRKIGNNKLTKSLFPIIIGIGMILMILYYFIGSTGTLFTEMMSDITLPLGYAFIIWGILFSIVLTHFTIDDSWEWVYIHDIIVMLMVYGFLFLISAFGIVWYGVFVYFLFLVLIGLSSLIFISYTDKDNEDTIWVKTTLSVILFIFIFVYIIRSAFPHGWNNLMGASMNEYKYDKLTQNESIFTYRSDYVTPIATLNTLDPKWITKRAGALAESITLKKILTPERLENMWPSDLHQVLLFFISQIKSGKLTQEKASIEKDIQKIGNELYSSILAPKGNDVNRKWIYRIGTFMTYLINENRKRYIDDSLIFEFEGFFYDPSPEKTIERMKKIWLGYLLTDLNAATIDRDPRHALTTRFEHLLLTMRAKNLRLVDTDNLCLKVAISEYKAGKLQSDIEFIDIAGTNYESYRDGKVVYRTEKQNKCANYVLNILNTASKNKTVAPDYLIPLQTSLGEAKNQAEQQAILSRTFGQSYFALFEIIDAPTEKISPVIPTQNNNPIATWSSLTGSIQ